MTAYLPSLHQLSGFAGLVVMLALLTGLGSIGALKREPPETRLLAGWGIYCLVMTLCAVLTPVDLRIAFFGLALAAAALLWRGRGHRFDGVGAMLAVSAPLWLILAAERPSQVDTWLNLLPNAAYLYDHDVLPTAAGPDSHSFLPVAPYNTQFVAYGASLIAGSFAESAMGWFNLALDLGAALLVARAVVADGKAPPLWACALGFLLLLPLNPGFVPRVFLAPYGEAPLAVTVLFAVAYGSRLIDRLATGQSPAVPTVVLGLVLAAMVNTKQSGLGLVIPVGIGLAAAALGDARVKRPAALLAIALALAPAIALYLAWRPVADASFPTGELKLRAFADWNWTLIPGILKGTAGAIARKVPYFVALAAVLALAVKAWRDRDPSPAGRAAILTAGIAIGYTGFIFFIDVAHFPPDWALEAHSFFRYESQLSFAVILVPALTGRAWAAARIRTMPASAGAALIGIALVVPVGAVRFVRFDLDPPQTELWRIAADAKTLLDDEAHVALIVPGDSDHGLGSALEGMLRYVPPRRANIETVIEGAADGATLDRLAASGVDRALVTCTGPSVAGAPPGTAALLAHDEDGWRSLRAWRYDPKLASRRFSANMKRVSVCLADRAGD